MYRRQSGGCSGFVHGCQCHLTWQLVPKTALAWRGDSWAKHPWPHPLGGTPLTTAQSWGGSAWGLDRHPWACAQPWWQKGVCACEQRPLGSSALSTPAALARTGHPQRKPYSQGWASLQAMCAGKRGVRWGGGGANRVKLAMSKVGARRPLARELESLQAGPHLNQCHGQEPSGQRFDLGEGGRQQEGRRRGRG